MTSPGSQPDPRIETPERPASQDGLSFGFGAMVLLALSAAIVFWAGLTLGGQTSGRDDQERTAVEAFTESYRRINDQYIGIADPGELVDAAICGMFETLDDPYSVCMPEEEYSSRFEDVTGEFGGIGSVMRAEDASGATCEPLGLSCRLRVVEVLKDTPAAAAGLLAGDRVTGVDGGSLDDLTVTDSVLLIRGPRGTDVTLTIERDGEELDLVITRDTITVKDVRSAPLADGRIGYISIDNFSANAASDLEDALREHIEADVEGLILDVRGDPGGFVDAAIDVTSEFLADGAVFWEEDAEGQQRSVDVTDGGIATDPELEMVVLIDGGSASASEIVAGALQDAGRAQLVGEPTFGKGTVQEWTELPGETGGFRLSVAKWLTRNKTWIDGAGISPDVSVAPGGAFYGAGSNDDPADDVQLQAAIALLLDEPLPAASPGPSRTVAPSPLASSAPSTDPSRQTEPAAPSWPATPAAE